MNDELNMKWYVGSLKKYSYYYDYDENWTVGVASPLEKNVLHEN